MDVLKDLNFQSSDFHSSKNNIFEYNSNLGILHFIKMEGGENLENRFYDIHRDIWNENKSEIFIAIVDENKVLICDSKTRPEQKNPIENVKIKSFEYGENTEEAKRYMGLLKKESIDNGFFWEDLSKFIAERKKRKKRSPIDEDLLNNLIERRSRLQKIIGDNGEDISQKLIDKCLFIRFIEDRLGFRNLIRVVEKHDIVRLLELFKSYNEALNGDLFEKDDVPSTINPIILNELDKVFGEYYVYSSGQRTISPYKFDRIPILLISNIYQKFLEKDKKDSDGIVFTPENLVDFMVDNVFESEDIKNRAKKGQIKILDSACGSGIFLVKSFERLLNERQGQLNRLLNIHEKGKLLKKCIYGIDLDQNALRVAAFSLYLKIFEGENPKTLKKEIFDRCNKGLEHFMFPGLKGENLIKANSLFDDVLNFKFDLILGNPPWGYEFDDAEKREIDNLWGKDVSDYQSSQCFLHQTKKWMDESTIANIIVNISNFTNTKAARFRKRLLEDYSILNFISLIKIKEITFEESDEPACILNFTLKEQETEVRFLIPDLTKFSKITKTVTIREGDISKFSQEKLLDDICWHISLLGLNRYNELIDRIGEIGEPIKKYFRYSIEGPNLYSTEIHGDVDKAKQEYESDTKKTPDYLPLTNSIKGILPYLYNFSNNKFILYGSHLKRAPPVRYFEGNKLVVPRSWPIKAFSVFETIIFSSSFDILNLKENYSKDRLFLFEAILNSKLASFYLAAKYLQRAEGNFSKINKEHLEKFPIPNLENKEEIITQIIKNVHNIKESEDLEKYRDRIDELVFDLYELDYYERTQILDYYTLQKRRKESQVTEADLSQYIEEFQDSFSSVVKEEYTLNAECYSSDFLGSLIRFKFSEFKKMPKYNLSRSLKKLLGIIQREKLHEIDYKSMLEEKKLKIYNEDSLIIYKSNQLRDWTRTEAMNDVREEIGAIYRHLPE